MLYEYHGKIYVRPFPNKIVEVEIQKNNFGDYNVIPTDKIVVEDNIGEKITSISLEEAYKYFDKKAKKSVNLNF